MTFDHMVGLATLAAVVLVAIIGIAYAPMKRKHFASQAGDIGISPGT